MADLNQPIQPSFAVRLRQLINATTDHKDFNPDEAIKLIKEIDDYERQGLFITDEELALCGDLEAMIMTYQIKRSKERLAAVPLPVLTLSKEDVSILESRHRTSELAGRWYCASCGNYPNREHKLWNAYRTDWVGKL